MSNGYANGDGNGYGQKSGQGHAALLPSDSPSENPDLPRLDPEVVLAMQTEQGEISGVDITVGQVPGKVL